MDAKLGPYDKDCRDCWPLPPTEQPEKIQTFNKMLRNNSILTKN